MASTVARQGQYRRQWLLSGHTGPINCLKFSDCGKFLASGADDGHVLVWSVTKGSAIQRIRPKQGPIHAIEWLYPQSSQDSALFFASADGTVQIWRKPHGQQRFEFEFMYTVFEGGVEAMALDETQNLLAVVGLGRVVILRIVLDNTHISLVEQVTEPPMSLPRRPGLARSAIFFDSGRSVMVGYLDAKQIVAWSVSPWKIIWAVKLRTRIGCMAWSSTTRTILVSNLVDGVDVYTLSNRPFFERRLSVGRIRSNVPQQVAFAQNGELIICGSDKGEVYVWSRSSGYSRKVLRHGEICCNQIVASHSPQDGTDLLASGSSDEDHANPYITLWTTNQDEWKNRLIPLFFWISICIYIAGVLMAAMLVWYGFERLQQSSRKIGAA